MKFDKVSQIPRIEDANGLHVMFNGGIRGSKFETDKWIFEPLHLNDVPSRAGYLTKKQLQDLSRRNGLDKFATDQVSWIGGMYCSRWVPNISGKDNSLRDPVNLWTKIRYNIGTERVKSSGINFATASPAEIHAIRNELDPIEILANSISLSLKCMSIHIESMWQFYNEQLTNFLARKDLRVGLLSSSTGDFGLLAHTNSFFVHFGAARDYLSSLIGLRLGVGHGNVDSLGSLLRGTNSELIKKDKIFNMLYARGLIVNKSPKKNEWQACGWLRDANSLRNGFIHSRPYGGRHDEIGGKLIEIDKAIGLYKYYRPFMQKDETEIDILDLVITIYKQTMLLFRDAAEISGYNSETLHLTDDDFIEYKEL